jgi:hypothetical protein
MQFMQLQLEPATSSTLPANGCGSIMQEIRLTNSMHGQVRIILFPVFFKLSSTGSWSFTLVAVCLLILHILVQFL